MTCILAAPPQSIEVEWEQRDGYRRRIRLTCGETALIEVDEEDAKRIGAALIAAAGGN